MPREERRLIEVALLAVQRHVVEHHGLDQQVDGVAPRGWSW